MKECDKSESGRRSFLKTVALASAAMTLPLGLDKLFGNNTQMDELLKDNRAADKSMVTRTLGTGKAAFEVSALGMGVMGMNYNRSQSPKRQQCIELLNQAVEQGITLFDTAIIYGPLINDELEGDALSSFKNKVSVTTKFGHEVINGKSTGRQDSRPATIRQYCEDSLRRLKIDSILNQSLSNPISIHKTHSFT